MDCRKLLSARWDRSRRRQENTQVFERANSNFFLFVADDIPSTHSFNNSICIIRKAWKKIYIKWRSAHILIYIIKRHWIFTSNSSDEIIIIVNSHPFTVHHYTIQPNKNGAAGSQNIKTSTFLSRPSGKFCSFVKWFLPQLTLLMLGLCHEYKKIYL